MNIDLEALHLNPLNYCDLILHTATVVLFAARSRVSCTYLFLSTLYLVSATLRHFYLSSMSHTYSPPSFPPPSYHLSDGFLLSHLSSDWSTSVTFVTRRLVFARCIPQARPQLLVHTYAMFVIFATKTPRLESPRYGLPVGLRNHKSRLRPDTRIHAPQRTPLLQKTKG